MNDTNHWLDAGFHLSLAIVMTAKMLDPERPLVDAMMVVNIICVAFVGLSDFSSAIVSKLTKQ